MPTPQEILEQLETCNDGYHTIINNIMKDEDTPVEVKVHVGAVAKGIFESMNEAHKIFKKSVEN